MSELFVGKVCVRPLISGVKLFAESAELSPRVLGAAERIENHRWQSQDGYGYRATPCLL